jgi:hypothetical protein
MINGEHRCGEGDVVARSEPIVARTIRSETWHFAIFRQPDNHCIFPSATTQRTLNMSQFRALKLDIGCFAKIRNIRDHTKRKVFAENEPERCDTLPQKIEQLKQLCASL